MSADDTLTRLLKSLAIVALVLFIALEAAALYFGVRTLTALGRARAELEQGIGELEATPDGLPIPTDETSCLEQGGLWLGDQCVFD